MASRETHDFSVLPSAWKDGSMIIDGTANDFSFNTVFFWFFSFPMVQKTALIHAGLGQYIDSLRK